MQCLFEKAHCLFEKNAMPLNAWLGKAQMPHTS
jgi:hypothetical protein